MVRLPFSWAGSSEDPNAKRPDKPAERKVVPRNLKSYYHILAVPRNATTEEIEQAYGRMLEKFGPHVSISEVDPQMQINMLREINEAYRVLMNPSRRKAHDVALTRYMGKDDVGSLSKKLSDKKSSPE